MPHTEFLFFINHQQAKIFEFHFFPQQAMRANDDIDFPFFEPLQCFFFFLCMI